jgi:WD40 repeat protein/serine/threonine protein kinase
LNRWRWDAEACRVVECATMPEQHQSERSLFEAAIEKGSTGERAAYLDEACGTNEELRQGVEALLAAHDRLGGGQPTSGSPRPVADVVEVVPERPGNFIGPYKLLEQIGEGGFGVVFMAEQQKPLRRRVALKVLKPGMDSRQVIARFEAERQALALMDHPHIAKILDAGTTAGEPGGDGDAGTPSPPARLGPSIGRPYFVMELVRGVSITQHCDENQLTPRQRLELFVTVCQAVQHAHQKGIIHRDIKPSNVLVTLHDGRPVVKVIDFGIAKALGQQLTDKSLFTGFAQLIGTPLYMSPEQAEMSGLDIDTRTDIYALGVLLYELLTGITPFDKERLRQVGLQAFLRILCEEEPPRPSKRLSTLGQAASTVSARRRSDSRRLSQLFRGELDWIVMKALEKDRTRRYETASALAADVQRHLRDEPVQACPPSALYRFGKFARRNKGGLLAGLLTMAALVAAVVVLAVTNALIQAETVAKEAALNDKLLSEQDKLRAEQQRSKHQADNLRLTEEYRKLATKGEAAAKQQLATIRRSQYALQLALVAAVYERDPGRGKQMLDDENRCPPDLRDFTWALFYRLCQRERQLLPRDPRVVLCTAFSPDGKTLATGSRDKTVKIWDVASGRRLAVLESHTGLVFALAYAPDGKTLASAGSDKIILWDVLTWEERASGAGLGVAFSMAFSPDSKMLTVANLDRTVRLLDVATGKATASWPDFGKGSWSAMAISPDGKTAALGSAGVPHWSAVILWDLEAGQQRAILKGHTKRVKALAFSPRDGKTLASASEDTTIKLWDVASGQELATLRGHTSEINALAFSRDGRILASVDEGMSGKGCEVKLWDTATGQAWTTLPLPTEHGVGLALSPDGQTLATPTGKQFKKAVQVQLWNVTRQPERLTLDAKSPVKPAVFAPDGKVLAAASGTAVLLWEVATGQLLSTFDHGGIVHAVAFTPNGESLLSAGGLSGKEGLAVQVWDVARGKRSASLAEESGTVFCVACAPDGNTWATATGTGGLKVWQADTGQVLWQVVGHAGHIHCTTYAPGSATLATGSRDKTVKLWDVATGQLRATLQGHKDQVFSLAFSPDGKSLASASADRTVKVWDVVEGKELLTLTGHAGSVLSVAFSPNGRTLATGGLDKTVRLWDPVTGVERASFQRHLGAVMSVAFDRNGGTLASASADKTVKLWNATASQEK